MALGELHVVGDVIRTFDGVYDADPQLVAGSFPAADGVAKCTLTLLEGPPRGRRVGEDLIHRLWGGVLARPLAVVGLPGVEHVLGGRLWIRRRQVAVDEVIPCLWAHDAVDRQSQ